MENNKKIDFNLDNYTIEEKLSLLIGKNNWSLDTLNGKLPNVFLSDGPCGLRMMKDDVNTIPATSYPTISHLATSWDKETTRKVGKAIADECIENGADVLLAPGVNIKRTPLNGRNFEYFSEDPFLAGTLGYEYIVGVQEKGIGTSLKHFCCNNREFDRHSQSSEVDERALREIYVKPFEMALKANPWTVMSSYNPINGVPASENRHIIYDILRKDLGYKGLVVSDWDSVYSAYRAVKATVDLRMPYQEKAYQDLYDAYKKGLITEKEINESVLRILKFLKKKVDAKKKVEYSKEERHNIAVECAKEGMVLLKNEDNVLPLQKNKKYLITGYLNENPVICGGGSACVYTNYKQKPLQLLLNDFDIEYKLGIMNDCVYGIKTVYDMAYQKDAVIICAAPEYEREGQDRFSLKLNPYYENIIINMAKINPNVIVLLYSGSPVDMSNWIDKVKGVILVGLAGEGVNEALSDILSGKVSPSGKLAETYPINLENSCTGLDIGDGAHEWYKESIFVGYRWYEKFEKPVTFPFGFGLSYAKFKYSDLEIKKISETDYIVSYDIENLSDFDAKEVSELYIRDITSSVLRPLKELKGFSKDLIYAHQKKKIEVFLDKDAFSFYSIVLNKWYVENGYFEVLVGSSSKDIHLVGKIKIELPEDNEYTNNTIL